MSTAGRILKSAVLYLCGIVCMTGAGTVFQIAVVTGTGVPVADDSGNGCTAGKTIQNTSKKLRLILFAAWGGPVVLSRSTPVQKCLQ